MAPNNWRARVGAWVGGFGVPGGFDATSGQRRLKGFVTSRAHVNALIAASGPEMNARSSGGAALQPLAMDYLLSETMGADTYLIGRIGDVQVSARCAPGTPAPADGRAHLLADVGRLHLFDPVTQRRLPHGR